MSLIRNTNKPISSQGGVVIHGHSLSFQLGQPETIAGKHEIREMKADGAVVDVWIARSELNKSRDVIKFRWVGPEDGPLRMFCKVIYAAKKSLNPRLAMSGFMVRQKPDSPLTMQMFTTKRRTKGIPAPRWDQMPDVVLNGSNILATATVSFYTIKSDTEAIVFKQSGYKSIQHYTSEFLEPSRWCRHLIDPFNADFTVKFLFRPEILCEYPVGEEPELPQIEIRNSNCPPRRQNNDGSDSDDVINLISSDEDDDEEFASQPESQVNELADLQNELSRLKEKEAILQRKIATEKKKIKDQIKLKSDKIKQMEKILLS